MSLSPVTITRRSACAAIAMAASTALTGFNRGIRPVGATNQPASPVPTMADRRWQGRSLTVSGWGGDIQDALRVVVWEPFAAATGCEIQEAPADLAHLQASVASGSPYTDLMLVSGVWAESELGQALTAPFLTEPVTGRDFSPFSASDRGAPAFAYAAVNTFHRELQDRQGAPMDWFEWWDQTAFPGARALSRSPLGTFEFALLADGVEPRELYPLDPDRAFDSLARVRDAIATRWWTNGFEPIGWLSTGAADLASTWHYRTIAAQRDGRSVAFEWQAGLLVADVWVSPAGSGNAEIAADLVDFATSPAVQAELAARVPLGPVVPAAFESIEEQQAVWMPTYPPNLERLILYDPSWWGQHFETMVERFDCWLGLGPC